MLWALDAQNEQKKQKARFKRNESKSDSELRKLKKENARLQEELSMTQQTPREEVTCKGEISDARKRVVQLRLMYNAGVSERMLKDKQLINLSNKVNTINMELGSENSVGSPASGAGVGSPGSSLQSLAKLTTFVEEEHKRLKKLLVDTDKKITEMECFQMMLQYRKKQYILTQNGMESQYKSLRKSLNILDKQHHEIELNVRTLEHGEIAALGKAEDIILEIKKYEKQREELKNQQKVKKQKQERIQEYMKERELNRQNLKKELNGDAWDMVTNEDNSSQEKTTNFMDIMFEKFMDTLVSRVGGTNLSAVLNKLETMNETQDMIENKKVETELKLQSLEKEKVQLQEQLQEIAVNGTDFSFRRHEIDEIEEKTHQTTRKLKHLLGNVEKTAKQLAGAQIGIDAISTKLDNLKVKVPTDQQKVEAKPDKSVVPLGIQSSLTGVDTHKGETDRNTEEHEDPLLRQLDSIEQKLFKLVDSLASSHMNKTAGEYQEGDAEGAQNLSWLTSDMKKMGMEMPQQGQYNLRVNLHTPTAALPSAPSSAGAFDAEALSDDSLEMQDQISIPVKKSRNQFRPKQAKAKQKRNKSKSMVIPNSKPPKPNRAKHGSMFTTAR